MAEAPAASEEVAEPAPMEVDKPQSPVKGKSSKSKSKSKSQPEAVKAEVAVEPSPAKAPSSPEGVAAAAPEVCHAVDQFHAKLEHSEMSDDPDIHLTSLDSPSCLCTTSWSPRPPPARPSQASPPPPPPLAAPPAV